MFKNLCDFFFFLPKYFVFRLSHNCRASVTNLSPRNLGKFTMRNFRVTHTNIVRVSHDGRATDLRKTNILNVGLKINVNR